MTKAAAAQKGGGWLYLTDRCLARARGREYQLPYLKFLSEVWWLRESSAQPPGPSTASPAPQPLLGSLIPPKLPKRLVRLPRRHPGQHPPPFPLTTTTCPIPPIPPIPPSPGVAAPKTVTAWLPESFGHVLARFLAFLKEINADIIDLNAAQGSPFLATPPG